MLYGIALKQGEPAPGVKIELIAPDGAVSQTTTDDAGTFTFNTPHGMARVRWTTSAGLQEGQIEIIEGDDAEVELEID